MYEKFQAKVQITLVKTYTRNHKGINNDANIASL